MCNKREIAALPAITVLRFEKKGQKGQNFGLTLNIGPAFSDRSPQYRPQTVWEVRVAEKQNHGISGSKG